MIVLDANVLVSAVLGRAVRSAMTAAADRGLTLRVPEPQLCEAVRVLVKKIGFTHEEARAALDAIAQFVGSMPVEYYAGEEQAARARLHSRGQPDWPVLAAALAVGGAIWSHDRDFFGVGAPVWTTRNLRFAET